MKVPETTAPGQHGHAMFAALAVPNFRRYVAGQSLSLIGTWVETVAPWSRRSAWARSRPPSA